MEGLGERPAREGVAPAFDIALLGTVTLAGTQPTTRIVTRRHDRLALGLLVLERARPIAREELAEVLWPDALPSSWETAIRGVVHRLRHAFAAAGLGDKALKAESGSLRLRLPDDVRIDVEIVANLLEHAERDDGTDPAESFDRARTIVSALSAPFLADCAGLWVEAQQRRVSGMLHRAEHALADAALAFGEYSRAIQTARSLLASDPCDERAHQVLIAAHAARRDRTAALAAYEQCRRTLRDGFGLSPAPETEAAYLAVLAGDEISSRSAAARLPFVGRQVECSELAAAWSRVCAGRAEAIVLSGEAGVGKSRLAYEMARTFGHVGASVLEGREDEGLAYPYRPIVDAFATYLRRCDPVRRLELEANTPRLVQLASHSSAVRPASEDPGVDSDVQGQLQFFDEVRNWLTLAAGDAPLVFVLDDVHWSSPSTLRCLRHVLLDHDRLRLLLICTSRTEAEPRPEIRDDWSQLLRLPTVRRLRIAGLGADEVHELLEDVFDLAADEDPGLSASLIVGQTAGNALYITEVIRQIGIDVRARIDPDGRVSFTSDAVREAIPAALGGLIERRIDALADPTRAVLDLAAVAGESTPVALLVAAHGDGAAVHDALGRLRLLGIVSIDRQVVAFRHDIVRTIVLERLCPAEVTSMHRRLAMGAAALDGVDAIVRRARHWSAAATSGDEAAREAVHWCRAAGEHFVRSADFGQAAAYFADARDALDLADPIEALGAERCDLMILEGEALHASGSAAYEQVLTRAVATARRIGDPMRLARAALSLKEWGMPSSMSGHASTVVAALQEALAGLDAHELAMRARVQAALALELRWVATPDESAASMHGALTLATGSGEPLARATALIAQTGLGRLDPSEALKTAEELRGLGLELGFVPATSTAAIVTVDALIRKGRVETALDELAVLERMTSRLPLPYFRWVGMTRRAGISALTGEGGMALEMMSRAREAGLVIGLDPVLIAASELALHLTVGLEHGELEAPLSALEDLGESVGENPSWHASMAAGLAELGRPDAQRHLDAVVIAADALQHDELGQSALVNGARAAARLGDERGSVFSAFLAANAGQMNWTSCVSFGPIDLARAWIAAAGGDRSGAHHLFDAAAELCRSGGIVTWLRRIELEQASVARDGPIASAPQPNLD